MYTGLSNTLLPQATEINGKGRLSIPVCQIQSIPKSCQAAGSRSGNVKQRFSPPNCQSQSMLGRGGLARLEGFREWALSSPCRHRPGQKALATRNHLVDLNICPELEVSVPETSVPVQFPDPRDLQCHKFSSLSGCPWGNREDREQTVRLQITIGIPSRGGIRATSHHAPAPGRGTEEEEEVETSRTTPWGT